MGSESTVSLAEPREMAGPLWLRATISGIAAGVALRVVPKYCFERAIVELMV